MDRLVPKCDLSPCPEWIDGYYACFLTKDDIIGLYHKLYEMHEDDVKKWKAKIVADVTGVYPANNVRIFYIDSTRDYNIAADAINCSPTDLDECTFVVNTPQNTHAQRHCHIYFTVDPTFPVQDDHQRKTKRVRVKGQRNITPFPDFGERNRQNGYTFAKHCGAYPRQLTDDEQEALIAAFIKPTVEERVARLEETVLKPRERMRHGRQPWTRHTSSMGREAREAKGDIYWPSRAVADLTD